MLNFKCIPLIIIILFLTACSSWWKNDEEYNPYQGMTSKQLYTTAKKSLHQEQYETAAKQFEAMDTLYPFSKYAQTAQLDLIYAYYKKNDFASAAAAADRFIHLYPRSKNVDYAYYMKGLANFQQPRGTFAHQYGIDEAWRDSGTQSQSYTDFATLVERFPNSKYKTDALQRMIYLRNMFAQHELYVAGYYLKRKMYVAAAERASYLLKNYPQAPGAKEALAILHYANKALGLNKSADNAVLVFRDTYNKPLPKLDQLNANLSKNY